MFSNTRTTRIEWGDCDPAGIIYYVRYFEIFDVSTTMFLERVIGMKKIQYLKAYNFLGHPVVETRAKFRLPTRFGDEVRIDTQAVSVGRSSIKLEHRLFLGEALAVEGSETRVWSIRDPNDPLRVKSEPIPAEIAARLRGESAPPG
jgi:4-hydroxybenzoyl-CoA thioesterase